MYIKNIYPFGSCAVVSPLVVGSFCSCLTSASSLGQSSLRVCNVHKKAKNLEMGVLKSEKTFMGC